jgi:MoaA/NifB/PqqE/SkfB family radical SAM enzyme
MVGNLSKHKCKYCCPGSNDGTVLWPDVELVKENLSHLLNHYKMHGKDQFNIYFVGGEPTLWKDFPMLIKHLKENFNVVISISTNGSRSISWWNKNAQYFDSIEMSVHHEFAKIHHLMTVADLLYEKEICIVANVLMDPTAFEKCQGIIETMKTSIHSWPIMAKNVHFDGRTRYTEIQKLYFSPAVKRMPDMDWYKKVNRDTVWKKRTWVIFNDDTKNEIDNNSWFILNGLNHFNGWTCNLGVDHLEIHHDGTVSGNCKQKILGLNYYHNLYDSNFKSKFISKIVPTICRQLICGCSNEIVINKKKI